MRDWLCVCGGGGWGGGSVCPGGLAGGRGACSEMLAWGGVLGGESERVAWKAGAGGGASCGHQKASSRKVRFLDNQFPEVIDF